MSAVADSSPLVILAKLGCFDLLGRLFARVYIPTEVHEEVVVAGAGLPGAMEVSKAEWIEIRAVRYPGDVLTLQRKYGLGLGEISAILLAKEAGANCVLLDDYRARKLANAENLKVLGSVGLLEAFHRRGYLPDLRGKFRELVKHNVYIDQRLLDRRLKALGLPTL